MNYAESIEYLQDLNRFGSQLGLSRIEALVAELGHPERSYKTIHVTGTNGKGSVSAMLSAALKEGGLKTGLYTSPHLCCYEERMQINGQMIRQADLAHVLTKVQIAVNKLLQRGLEQPTQFEVLTAAAFLYFQEEKVDIAVIEVGLGGLLDSTNVITPELSIITNVTLEHQDKCGPTIQDIAKHKAGIIKQGVPLITGAQGEALAVLLAQAEEKQAQVKIYGQHFQAESKGTNLAAKYGEVPCQTLIYKTENRSSDFQLALLGQHQLVNSAIAVSAYQELAKRIPTLTEDALAKGLKQVRWPARFEVFPSKDSSWVVDGAHNPAGMRALRQALDDYFPGPVLFILGILKDKAQDEMLKLLLRPQDRVITVPVDSERASKPEELAEKIQHCTVQAAATLADAIALAESSNEYKTYCIAGSLYMVGEARILLESGGMVRYNERNQSRYK